MVERLILYHNNEGKAFCIAVAYGFLTSVFTETALHEFVLHAEHSLVRKKAGFGYFRGYCRCL